MRNIEMLKIEEGYEFRLSFDYDPDIVTEVKSIKTRYFNSSDKSWTVPLTTESVKKVIQICKDFEFEISFSKEALIEAIKEVKVYEEKDRKVNDFTLPDDGDYLVYAKRTKENRIFLKFDYSAVLVEDVKSIPGAKFVSNSRRVGWEIDVDLENMKAVYDFLKESFVYNEDKKYLEELKTRIDSQLTFYKNSKAIESKIDLNIPGLAYELRPFQKVAVDYALKVKRLFIADDMGCLTGDTIVSIDNAGHRRPISMDRLYQEFKFAKKSKVVDLNYIKDPIFYILGLKEDGFDYLLIIDVLYSGIKPVYKLTLDNKSELRATADHEILTKLGYRELQKIQVNDLVRVADFKRSSTYSRVKKIEYAGETHVYDIKVEAPYHNFVADGIVVHNCGKTIEALASFQASNTGRCLVVCPSSVKYNWLLEAQKWLPSRKSVVLELNKDKSNVLDNGDINIIHYNMLSKVWPKVADLKFDMAIFDESHRLNSKNSQWSKTAYEISRHTEYCLLLSGTPILNRPADIIHPLTIIDKIALFGGEWKFKKSYCDLKKTRFGWTYNGATNTEDLNKKLRSSCYIRRMKNQVLTELPEKQRAYIPVILSPSDRKIYNKAQKDIADWILSNKEEIRKFFVEMYRKDKEKDKDEKIEELKKYGKYQFQRNTMMKLQKAETLIKISKLRRIAAEAKVDQFCDWVEDFMKTGNKLIIFAVHRVIIEKLKDKLGKYGVVLIHGDIDSKDRQDTVEKFQSDPRTQIIICNIQAGGIGLTLTAASDVAFIEFDFSLSNCLQAEDRAYRIGQEKRVNIWYFYGQDTIDLDLIEILQAKEKIISSTVDGSLSDEMFENVIKKSLDRISKSKG